jgi:hyperosmotically inducible periplasmic protein
MRLAFSSKFPVLLGAALISLGTVAQAANTSRLTPLETRVRHEIVMLPYYNVFDDISFRVAGGTVTLSGEVTQPVLKSDAGNVVKHVEGVTRVVNNIEVLPLSPMDDQIRMAVAGAIYGYGPLQRYGMGTQPPIRILVKNGNVTLAGVVDNTTDRNLAYIRANGVPGVFSVTNRLRAERG